MGQLHEKPNKEKEVDEDSNIYDSDYSFHDDVQEEAMDNAHVPRAEAAMEGEPPGTDNDFDYAESREMLSCSSTDEEELSFDRPKYAEFIEEESNKNTVGVPQGQINQGDATPMDTIDTQVLKEHFEMVINKAEETVSGATPAVASNLRRPKLHTKRGKEVASFARYSFLPSLQLHRSNQPKSSCKRVSKLITILMLIHKSRVSTQNS
ncbi:hypothetical protein J5N97_026640 [Dioscorea zingiberensis]|uniref:Uncharacterized protein n=1 Tax=Dioscorea zingiberensis TaxID=325984 RepID=A0A9D5C3W3_9LILI|nr:hypothetical protein J5N97_026640 [Dioscorea zingiberensis]